MKLPSLIQQHGASAYGIVVWLTMSAQLLLFHGISRNSFSIYIGIYSLMEIFFLFFPYWWLKGRWRAMTLIFVWALSIYFFSNMIYFRFWGSMMPLDLFRQAGNANGVLAKSIIHTIQAVDWFYLLSALALTSVWLCPAARKAVCAEKFPLRLRVTLTALATITYLALIFLYNVRMSEVGNRTEKAKAILSGKTPIKLYNVFMAKNHRTYKHLGITLHLIYEFENLLLSCSTFSLTPEERKSLNDYLAALSDGNADHHAPTDRNLIFIIVESLDADMIGATVGGKEVTPVMNSLAASHGSVCALKMTSQIGAGSSCDGQLMYNLGVLPTLYGVGSVDFVPHLKNIPSLPHLLPKQYTSEAIFADGGSGWGKTEAYLVYGYAQQYSNHAFRHMADGTRSTDGLMLHFALQRAQQPFYMQLLTIQMHYPSDTGALRTLTFETDSLPEERVRYLNCTADFDRNLGIFIDGLKKAGRWDNTTLVIASDHNYQKWKDHTQIAFIAANTDTTLCVADTVRQIDVFPTVLDIMGLQSKWRGTGHSMLGPRRGEWEERQIAVSDSILRSDFFR